MPSIGVEYQFLTKQGKVVTLFQLVPVQPASMVSDVKPDKCRLRCACCCDIHSTMTLEEALAGKEIPEAIGASLELVDIEYVDFAGVLQNGQLVVHRELAMEVRDIFSEILAARFPIAKMVPVVAYDWSDDASMADNNCSAFNYRYAVGKSTLSHHAFGRAVDINPVQNPYVKNGLVLPPGAVYEPEQPGTLLTDGLVVAAFEERGWTWGGRWSSLKDWHHFEKA